MDQESPFFSCVWRPLKGHKADIDYIEVVPVPVPYILPEESEYLSYSSDYVKDFS